jgi:hypothetical protein
MTPKEIEHRLRSGRWRRVHWGVYATVTGPLSWEARLWAAVLACGRGATLSHETAAVLHGLSEAGRSGPIHVTIPVERDVRRKSGILLHRSVLLEWRRHPVRSPPRTRIEHTVVDLTQTAPSIDRAVAVMAEAVRRRLTTHDRIADAMRDYGALRWRPELLEVCGMVGDGVHSRLEYRFVTRVARPHGLPAGVRQARLKVDGRTVWVDVYYEAYRVRVELDGQRGHTGDGALRDARRDNRAVLAGDAPLRLGWDDVTERPCATAAVVAKALTDRGWTGRLLGCGPRCTAERSAEELGLAGRRPQSPTPGIGFRYGQN